MLLMLVLTLMVGFRPAFAASDGVATPSMTQMTATGLAESPMAVEKSGLESCVPGRIIVTRKAPAKLACDTVTANAQVEAVKAMLNARTRKQLKLIGAEVWEFTGKSVDTAVAEAKKSGLFEYVEPDYVIKLNEPPTSPAFEKAGAAMDAQQRARAAVTPNDPFFGDQWNMMKIAAPDAWGITTGGDVVIAVMDTGCNLTHPDIVSNLWHNPEEIADNGIDDDGNDYIDDVYGWDFSYNDKTPEDGYGHGSHVAGIIAATGNNAVGVAGVCWSAKIMVLKMMDTYGATSVSIMVEALQYAVSKGARISNHSYSYGFGGSVRSQALLDAFQASANAGQLMVCAASNHSSDNDIMPFYPASFDINAVMAVMASLTDDSKAGFSCYGLCSVDLAAPGDTILSLANTGTGCVLNSGTSMASPLVAGAAALLLSKSPSLSNVQLKDVLMSTVDPASGTTCVSGGRLNLFRALQSQTTPMLFVDNPAVTEDNSNSNTIAFTVRLSTPATQNVTVIYATADGTASAGSDYMAASGTLTIPAGQLSGQVTVNVIGDTTPERLETFYLNLSDPVNAPLSDRQGLGMILNDDGPLLTITDMSRMEDNSSTPFTFTVSLTELSAQTVSVHYASANGTATAGSDYTAINGTLTIPAGQLSDQISVNITGDTTVELDETFYVNLSSPVNATIADAQGVGTILNDDILLSISDVSSTEGNSGTKPFAFTVSLSQAAVSDVSVHYNTAYMTATAGEDYTTTNGTLTIPVGQLSGQVTVQVVGDTIVEPDESFSVILSSPVNATIADAQGVGTILNDDDAAAIPFIDITSAFGCAVSNNVISVDFSIPLAIDGTNNQNVVGFMWMTTNSVGDWRISFPASAAWFCTTNVYMYPACMNSIYVYGSNVYGIVTNDVVMVYGIPEGIGACGLLSLVMIARGRRVLRK